MIAIRTNPAPDLAALLSLRYLTGTERDILERIDPKRFDLMDEWDLRQIEGLHRFELIERERGR